MPSAWRSAWHGAGTVLGWGSNNDRQDPLCHQAYSLARESVMTHKLVSEWFRAGRGIRGDAK